jgi:hypothetical protein
MGLCVSNWPLQLRFDLLQLRLSMTIPSGNLCANRFFTFAFLGRVGVFLNDVGRSLFICVS